MTAEPRIAPRSTENLDRGTVARPELQGTGSGAGSAPPGAAAAYSSQSSSLATELGAGAGADLVAASGFSAILGRCIGTSSSLLDKSLSMMLLLGLPGLIPLLPCTARLAESTCG